MSYCKLIVFFLIIVFIVYFEIFNWDIFFLVFILFFIVCLKEEVFWDNDSFLKVFIGSRVNIVNGLLFILKCMVSGLLFLELMWICGIEDLIDGERYNISISE